MSCTVISQWIFSNHMFTYLWNDIYDNLVVISVGLNLFSLLGFCSSSTVDASSFRCVVILSLYLTLNFVISSLTVGTFQSVCNTLLDIYSGPFTVVILSVYLTVNFVISSLTVGTFKSVCKTLLDIYRGAFTVARRNLFWYLCNIAMFELLAVSQRGIPCV
jgi:hypothetical protein